MSKKGKGKGSAKALKGLLAAVGIGALGGGALLGYVSTQYDPKTPEGTVVMDVDVSGLTKAEAVKKLDEWWAAHQAGSINIESDELVKQPGELSLTDLGVEFDAEETAASLPYHNFWSDTKARFGQAEGGQALTPKFKVADEAITEMALFVEANGHPPTPAKVKWVSGKIERSPERGGVELDKAAFKEAIAKAAVDGEKLELPLKPAARKVSDEDLAKITEVVASFSTNFNSGQVNRSSNIKLASEIVDGTVLMPGESWSFNERVGRRTISSGFKTAGVYVNGRHDYDVGGGICQVSSTLYNAVLLSNLKIVKRFNHSLPVPYVPLGRDATVSYPNPDLIIENSFDFPIALSAEYKPGKLEFRILGKKDPGLEVVIERTGQSSWSNGVKYVHDGSLAYGVEKVVDRGGNGHKISTFRVIKKNGEVVKRESLGTSTYRGGPKIVARNEKAKPPAETTDPDEGANPPAGGAGSDPGSAGGAIGSAGQSEPTRRSG